MVTSAAVNTKKHFTNWKVVVGLENMKCKVKFNCILGLIIELDEHYVDVRYEWMNILYLMLGWLSIILLWKTPSFFPFTFLFREMVIALNGCVIYLKYFFFDLQNNLFIWPFKHPSSSLLLIYLNRLYDDYFCGTSSYSLFNMRCCFLSCSRKVNATTKRNFRFYSAAVVLLFVSALHY